MARYWSETHDHYSATPGQQDYYDYDPLPTRSLTLDEIAAHEAAEAYALAIENAVLSIEWLNDLSARSALLMVSDPARGKHVGAFVQLMRNYYRMKYAIGFDEVM